MKKGTIKISASEINRFVYCPYQWYYGKTYGQKALKEKYKAVRVKQDHVQSQFEKGIRFHKNYYRSYRLLVCARIFLVALLIGSIIWMVVR